MFCAECRVAPAIGQPVADPAPDDDQIRHYLAGNLCRCAAYPEIVKAVKLAASKRQKVAA